MLLDTAGLLALILADERPHAAALELFDAADSRLTHSYIVSEFVAAAPARGVGRRRTLDFVADLSSSVEVEIVYVDKELHQEALGLLKRRLDKDWSLCDAVSFILMQRRNIREALTTDHHFEQAGFKPLLKP